MSGDAQSLVARWVEGELDEAGRRRLAELVAADPQLAHMVAGQARYAALLGLVWPHQDRGTADSVERLIEARRPSARLRLADGIERRLGRRRRRRLLRFTAVAAAAVLVIGTVLLLWPAPPSPVFRVIAGVARAGTAEVFAGGAVAADAGAVTAAGRDLVLQAEDGARLALSAGSRVELRGRGADGRQVAGLADGHLGWNAPHRAGAGGLRLALPQGSVVTEGTAFDCRVQAAAAVIRLAEGRVRVAGGTGEPVVLQPGEATVVRSGSPPSPPAAFPARLVWSGDGPAEVPESPQQLPWSFLPGVVPGETVGTWSSGPDGAQVCVAQPLPADFAWGSVPRPDHEVAVHAARRGSALLRLAHGCVLRFRVRAERSGTINVTISVPRTAADDPTLWASSEMVAVEAGRWQVVELPIAAFWSRVKADWEAAAIAGLGIWGYAAGTFAVSSIEIRLP
jgi:hypothetical protein